LVGTLAFSTAAAVLTRMDAMFLRMLSLVMVSNEMNSRLSACSKTTGVVHIYHPGMS
jgi:hypothetical protein